MSDATASNRTSDPGSRSRVILGLAALMVLHGALTFDLGRRLTPTLDEVAHLPAGLSYWQSGSFRMYPLNPPLPRLAAAAAVPRRLVQVDYTGTWSKHNPPSHWLFANEFVAANGQSPAAQQAYLDAFTAGRRVTSLWSVATIPVLFLWGRWWLGAAAGWVAAGLWTLSPNILTHASLITTDLPFTSTALVATWIFCRWLERPSGRGAALAGLVLGVAQLTKFTALLLLPAWGLLAILALVTQRGDWASQARRHAASAWLQPALMLVGMVLVLNAGYGFEGTGTPLGSFPFTCDALTRPRRPDEPITDTSSSRFEVERFAERVNRFRGGLLGQLPVPLPYWYARGFDQQKAEAEGGYQMYLAGELRRTGWWYYFLYALAVKVPLSTWLLVGLGLGTTLRNPESRMNIGIFALLAGLPVAAMTLLTDIDLGVRYVLAAIPFLFLLAGAAVCGPKPPACWRRMAVIACLVWNGVILTRMHPHELSFFNELANGPVGGRYHLIDSNLDWGQDLRKLARWLERHPDWADTVRVAYCGSVPPEFEGIRQYRLAPRDLRQVPPAARLPDEREGEPWSYGPLPGRYVVSANFERGYSFHQPLPIERAIRAAFSPGSIQIANPPWLQLRGHAQQYAYFQHFAGWFEPEVGYSLLFFDITVEEANRVRAKLSLPLLPE